MKDVVCCIHLEGVDRVQGLGIDADLNIWMPLLTRILGAVVAVNRWRPSGDQSIVTPSSALRGTVLCRQLLVRLKAWWRALPLECNNAPSYGIRLGFWRFGPFFKAQHASSLPLMCCWHECWRRRV